MKQDNYDELNIDKRREIILQVLSQNGKVKVSELSEMFGISEVTIRIDLTELEKAGLLERVHGGAISSNRTYYNMSVNERMKTNEAEKKAIALEAASYISDGDTLMINSGTTTLYTVKELKSIKDLTILTNSLLIAQEIGAYKNIHVILLGGNFNPKYHFTYGEDTITQLKRYNANKLILSVDGVSAERGITTYHYLEAEVNRQMIERADKTIVVADYTKINRASFAYIVPVNKADLLITNTQSVSEEIKMIEKKGPEIKLV
jgi:DeoR family fructose operon transcriptional repressor